VGLLGVERSVNSWSARGNRGDDVPWTNHEENVSGCHQKRVGGDSGATNSQSDVATRDHDADTFRVVASAHCEDGGCCIRDQNGVSAYTEFKRIWLVVRSHFYSFEGKGWGSRDPQLIQFVIVVISPHRHSGEDLSCHNDGSEAQEMQLVL